MDELAQLKKLAGINEFKGLQPYGGSNISITGTEKAKIMREQNIQPVSYTHLTLPTIYSV